MGMDRQTFEAGLKRDGYEILTNTTPGAKMNPEHSHPFDVRAMVLKGANPDEATERPDRWPLSEELIEVGRRWEVDPDRDLRRAVTA